MGYDFKSIGVITRVEMRNNTLEFGSFVAQLIKVCGVGVIVMLHDHSVSSS